MKSIEYENGTSLLDVSKMTQPVLQVVSGLQLHQFSKHQVLQYPAQNLNHLEGHLSLDDPGQTSGQSIISFENLTIN